MVALSQPLWYHRRVPSQFDNNKWSTSSPFGEHLYETSGFRLPGVDKSHH